MEFFDNKIDNELVSDRERERERATFGFIDIHAAICAIAP